MKACGKKYWAFSGGRIPLRSNGKEPENTSHDKIAVLNASQEIAHIEIFLFYENKPPVGRYQLAINPQRLKKIRFNDIIDPVAMPLDENYGCYIKSDAPVIIQFSRTDTGIKENAQCTSMAFPVDDAYT